MTKTTTDLSPDQLTVHHDPMSIPVADSTQLSPDEELHPCQPRAVAAMSLALSIRDRGYNLYVSGEPNMGRTYMVRDYLSGRAALQETPPDLLYVANFQDMDKPCLLTLPPGLGRELKNGLSTVMAKIRKDVPVAFDSEPNVRKRNTIVTGYQQVRDDIMEKMEAEAKDQGFNLNMDDQGGLTLYPLVEGKLLSEEEFEKLDKGFRDALKKRSDALMDSMSGLLKRIYEEDMSARDREQDLDREIMEAVLKELLDPLIEELDKKGGGEELADYFHDLREDMLDNLDSFLPPDPVMGLPISPESFQSQSGDDPLRRYEVNLLVDNAETTGAPVVLEDHPTPSNLLGCVEREAEMGALITDFTLVKAGSLHRANGGYLILHMEDLLQSQQQTAWEGLLRALRAGISKIEDGADSGEQTRTKTIEPDPVPLELKVVLVGTDDVYEILASHDDRFSKLFKIKAHLRENAPRDERSVASYIRQLGRIIAEAELKPFDRSALARLVEYGSRLCEDQKKISLKMPLVRELMIEASALAGLDGQDMVDGSVLARAEDAKRYRNDLYEEEFLEDYDRELIKVATTGEAVGRVNGLAVTSYGNYEFGLPHKIACSVGVGRGGVIDLEREAEMAGPIHTKAMMILKSYLLSLFAKDKPLVFTGSICFEQSYATVEGDSASGAELSALLSALAEVPVRRSLAVTGAVNQSGGIMAVGGVTPKIEGFFKVCSRRGLSGEQGVIIPRDNVDQLMLNDEVIEAVRAGQFHIHAVSRIEDMLELLTGVECGRPDMRGRFKRGTIYHRVDTRLASLRKLAGKSCTDGC